MTITYLEDIDKISYRFTDLGKALAEVSAQNKESLQDTAKTLQDGFQSLSKDIWANEALKALNATPQALELSVLSVTKMFETLIAKADVSLGEFIRSAQVSKTSLDEFTKALLAEKAKASTPGQGDQSEEGGSEGGGKDTRKKRKEKGKEKEKKQQLPKVIRQEINTLKSRFKGGLSKLKIPSSGQILGGLVAIMAYGYMEQDRMKKEAGEVKNALEGAVDAGMKGVLQTGTSRIAALQESLQKYSGIAKEESQAIAQTFAQGGVGIQEMLAGVDRSLGRVGKTAVHFTLGLDKMFEMSGGTTAQKVVGFMHNYGMSIKDASETVKDMYLNEQAMKIGAPTFVHNIESAAEAVKDFGFGIRGVMDIAGELQSAFDAVGVPKQFAGKLAGLGIQQMARGIASLSNDWKVLLGKNMGFSGEGTEVLQKVEEAFTRVKSGKSDEELKDLVLAMYNTAKSASEGDESRMYMMLSQKMEMGSYGARGIMEIGKAMEKGGAIEALKATKDHAKGLKDAFKTEAEKTGEFQRNMNKWMTGMSEVGQGLLGLVGKFLAYLIMMFRAFPSLLGASISRDFDRLRRIQLTINNALGSFSPDIALLKSGVSKMGSAGKEMFGDVFASSIGAMESAFTADFSGEAPKSKSKSSDFTGERMPIVRTVVLPSAVGGEQRVELEAAAEEAAEFASEHGQPWFGGGPILKNLGVNEHGGVQIALMGNCPRCGLMFGGEPPAAAEGGAFTSMGLAAEGRFTSEDVEAAGRVLATEMGGYREDRHNEAVGILQTLMNRGGRKGGGALYNKATGGHGWGRQGHGSKRQYGSRKDFKKGGKTEDFVRKFLRGEVNVPKNLKKALGFFHARQGDVFHGPGGYSGAVPKFASKGGQGIVGVETARPGYKTFFTAKGQADTTQGVQGRRWLGASGAGSGDAISMGNIPSFSEVAPMSYAEEQGSSGEG